MCRTGGTKVLMNDHIVRVNEIVDRETGLRLVKIEDDMLIFKDAKGTLYTKNSLASRRSSEGARPARASEA